MSGAWDGRGWMPEQVQTAPPAPNRGPWTIRLDHERAPYGLSANDRPKHWAVKSNATKAVREEVFVKVRAARVPALERIRVEVVWVVADRRVRDVDNLAPFEKAIFDGIGSSRGVSARIVDDDDAAHMEKARAVIRVEPGAEHHFEVTITDLGDAA